MMSTVGASLVLIQQNLIRYGFPLLLALGNLGNVLFVVIFCKRSHRNNPCSLYLIVSAIAGSIGLNWGLGTNLNAIYQRPDPFTISLVLCRTRGYLLQLAFVVHRTMILLACIDRYALSSPSAKIRAYSKPKLAMKLIAGTTLFWTISSLQQPFFQTIQNYRCYVFGTYGLIFSIYRICLYGCLFPALMMTFNYLLRKNLKAIRLRTLATQAGLDSPQSTITKRDLSLMKLVLAEVATALLLTFLYPINTLYNVLADEVPNKSQNRLQIEGFSTFITLIVLLYLNYCITFYLYLVMSASFRREVKAILFPCYRQRQANHLPQSLTMKQLSSTANRARVLPQDT